MKILMIGDVFAKAGRSFLAAKLGHLQQQYDIDFTIVNGENITHGKSISFKHYQFLKDLNVDVVTSGNHIFDLEEVLDYIDHPNVDLIKPLNLNGYTPGQGTILKKVGSKKIRVTNIIGRSFMMMATDNYYPFMDDLLSDDESDIHIVDFHGETTAEKIMFAWNYDGQITLCYGTHTHVQTADERVLPKGTAFISDIGMVGAVNSIIGMDPVNVIHRFRTSLPARFFPAEGPAILCGLVMEVDDASNKVVALERIFLRETAND